MKKLLLADLLEKFRSSVPKVMLEPLENFLFVNLKNHSEEKDIYFYSMVELNEIVSSNIEKIQNQTERMTDAEEKSSIELYKTLSGYLPGEVDHTQFDLSEEGFVNLKSYLEEPEAYRLPLGVMSIAVASQQEKRENPELNCVVLYCPYSEAKQKKNEFLIYLDDLVKKATYLKNRRQQLVCYHEAGHWFCGDTWIDEQGKLTVFLLEVTMNLLDIFNTTNLKTQFPSIDFFYCKLGIQFSSINCEYFSLDIACKLSRIEPVQLYREIRLETNTLGEVLAEKLPQNCGDLFENIQSLKRYNTLFGNKNYIRNGGENLDDFINHHTTQTPYIKINLILWPYRDLKFENIKTNLLYGEEDSKEGILYHEDTRNFYFLTDSSNELTAFSEQAAKELMRHIGNLLIRAPDRPEENRAYGQLVRQITEKNADVVALMADLTDGVIGQLKMKNRNNALEFCKREIKLTALNWLGEKNTGAINDIIKQRFPLQKNSSASKLGPNNFFQAGPSEPVVQAQPSENVVQAK